MEEKDRTEIEKLMALIEGGSVVGCGGGRVHGKGTPVGAVANNIANHFTTNEDAESRKALVTLLSNDHESARFPAYCCLMKHLEKLDPDTKSKLEEFRVHPTNAEIVLQAKERFGI